MSLKKILTLASMALAAVALAVPATASAVPKVVDIGTGKDIAVGAQSHFQGTAKFESLGTGVSCTIATSTLTATSTTTGTATFEAPDVTKCTGFGFTFAGCVAKEVKMTNGPFVVHTMTPHDFTVTNVEIFTQFVTDAAKCAHHAVELTFPEMTIAPTPGEAASTFTTHIKSATVTGAGTAHIYKHQATGTASKTSIGVSGHASLADTAPTYRLQ